MTSDLGILKSAYKISADEDEANPEVHLDADDVEEEDDDELDVEGDDESEIDDDDEEDTDEGGLVDEAV